MKDLSEARDSNIPHLDMQFVLKDARNFTDVKEAIIAETNRLRRLGATRIGFVSGPIGDTSRHIDDETGTAMEKSMNEMRALARQLSNQHHISIFSSADIFKARWDELDEGQKINKGLLVGKEKEAVMNSLFGGILEEGAITDIFMMDGWKNAPGALYERKIAENSDGRIIINELAQ